MDRDGEDMGVGIGDDGIGQRADVQNLAGGADRGGRGVCGHCGRGELRRRGRGGPTADGARGQHREEDDGEMQPAAHPPRVARLGGMGGILEGMSAPLTGGCLCGGVRYEVSAPLVSAGYCHCTRCQRRTGTAAAVWEALPDDGLPRYEGPAPGARE